MSYPCWTHILTSMGDNNEWLQRVVVKLNELHLNGFDFQDVHRWIFDWEDKLTSKENLENVRDEDRALTTIKQAGVISGISKDNFYREQQEWQLADKGFGMWSDWDTTDPAHREYDYIWFVDGFDYDRFKEFCESHGLNPNVKRTIQLKNVKFATSNELSKPEPNSIAMHSLEIRHYSTRKGILTLNPTTDVAIATKGKTKRPNGEKYVQCAVMDKLFKKVNNIKNGITFGQALTVNDNKIGKKEEKEIRNAVYEINKKVASVGGPDNLIKIQNKKVFVNNSYL